MGCSGGSVASGPSEPDVGAVAAGSAFFSSELDAVGVTLSGVALSR